MRSNMPEWNLNLVPTYAVIMSCFNSRHRTARCHFVIDTRALIWFQYSGTELWLITIHPASSGFHFSCTWEDVESLVELPDRVCSMKHTYPSCLLLVYGFWNDASRRRLIASIVITLSVHSSQQTSPTWQWAVDNHPISSFCLSGIHLLVSPEFLLQRHHLTRRQIIPLASFHWWWFLIRGGDNSNDRSGLQGEEHRIERREIQTVNMGMFSSSIPTAGLIIRIQQVRRGSEPWLRVTTEVLRGLSWVSSIS